LRREDRGLVMIRDDSAGRTRQWPGFLHETRHLSQLDGVTTLAEAAGTLRTLAAELSRAQDAGWWLVEPMRRGNLLAARESQPRRGSAPAPRIPGAKTAPRLRWRLRVIDEAPTGDDDVFLVEAAPSTPVLASVGGALHQVGGPTLDPDLLLEVGRQADAGTLGERRWGLAPARVGPSVDLVADGSALHLHAVRDGALVRTHETLTFQHAADGAASLAEAAAAYERLARAIEAMAAAGGRWAGCDDGVVHVDYAPS
jgi:hypothetical protein